MKGMDLFFSGTSGLVVPIPKTLYPEAYKEKSRLCYYASLYNSIEINSTFYKLPKKSTIETWAGSVPENFRFSFKLSKSITHVKALDFSEADADNYFDTIAPANKKQGCLLVQFPPGFKIAHLEQLEKFFHYLKKTNLQHSWPIAIEFRNETWLEPGIFKLLDQFNFTMVIHDLAGSFPITKQVKTGIKYLRFHGPEGNYRGSYTDECLSGYADHICNWIKNKETVYVYFNNTMGSATVNLQTLNHLVLHKLK